MTSLRFGCAGRRDMACSSTLSQATASAGSSFVWIVYGEDGVSRCLSSTAIRIVSLCGPRTGRR